MIWVGLAALAVLVPVGLYLWRVRRMATERVKERRAVEVIRPLLARAYREALVPFEHGDRTSLAELLLDEQPTSDRLQSLTKLGERVEEGAARAWAEASPGDPAARLLLAAVLLVQAHAARGSGAGDSVGEEAANRFKALSFEAEKVLTAVCDARPEDAVPWAMRMQAAFALTDDLGAFEALFAEASARDPSSFQVHARMLSAACAKWFGGHAEMFAVARKAASAHPASPLEMLVVAAHLERWLYLQVFDADPEAAAAYREREDVRREVRDAFDRFISNSPATLDGHLARAHAAAWFYAVGDLERLRKAFGELPIFFEQAWHFVGGERAYREARLWAKDEAG